MTKYIAIAMLVLVSVASADVPHLLNYQGRITDDSGTPMDGSHELTFRIYDDSTGGATLWIETHIGVTVTDGLFDVVLGSIDSIASSIFSSQPRWLGIQVDLGAELSPRTQIVSVAYAYRAEHADTADYAHTGGSGGGWVDDDTVIRLDNINDSVGIGTSNPAEKLQVNGDIRLQSMSDIAFGSDGVRVYGSVGSIGITASDDIRLHPVDDIYIRKDGGAYWVRFDNDFERLGIGTTDPQEKLHVDGNVWLDSDFGIAFGSDTSRLFSSTTDMFFAADDDIHLRPDDDIFVRRKGEATWVHFDNSEEKLGIGTMDPDEKLHVDGNVKLSEDSELHFGDYGNTRLLLYNNDLHITAYDDLVLKPVDDIYIRRVGGSNWVRFDNTDEMLGIGTSDPQEKFHVNGDMRVDGAYKGDISSSSGSDGAPFPRPAYNSGWFDIGPGESVSLTHDIGGDQSDYFVDMQMRGNDGVIHNIDHGGDNQIYGGEPHFSGVNFGNLTSSGISVLRRTNDMYSQQVRIRIWVIK